MVARPFRLEACGRQRRRGELKRCVVRDIEPPVVVKFSRVALLTVSVPLATKYPGALLPLIVPLMVVSLVMRVCAEAGTTDATRE